MKINKKDQFSLIFKKTILKLSLNLDLVLNFFMKFHEFDKWNV